MNDMAKGIVVRCEDCQHLEEPCEDCREAMQDEVLAADFLREETDPETGCTSEEMDPVGPNGLIETRINELTDAGYDSLPGAAEDARTSMAQVASVYDEDLESEPLQFKDLVSEADAESEFCDSPGCRCNRIHTSVE